MATISKTMNTISIFYFVLLVISLLPCQILGKLLGLGQAPRSPDLITKTCDQTRYRNLCITSLRSNNESEGADLQGLAKISLKIALSNASETHNYISELLNKTKDKYMQQCLADCSRNYKQAVGQIEDSLKDLNSKGYENVKTWVSAAMSNAESCENGFDGKPGHLCPFAKMNKFFDQLCSISLSITSLLAGAGWNI